RLFTPLSVFALERILGIVERALDIPVNVGADLFAIFAQAFLGLVNHRIALIFQIDDFTPLLVFGGVLLGVVLHLLDLVLVKAAGVLDGDLVFLAGAQILGVHVEDAVHVY